MDLWSGFEPQVIDKEGVRCIYDVVRKKYLQLTPEELVRQYFVHYLQKSTAVSLHYVKAEYPIRHLDRTRRADLVAFNRALQPILMVECKAFHKDITPKVLSQMVAYNQVLNMPLLALTNGKKHYFWQKNEGGSFAAIPQLPSFHSW